MTDHYWLGYFTGLICGILSMTLPTRKKKDQLPITSNFKYSFVTGIATIDGTGSMYSVEPIKIKPSPTGRKVVMPTNTTEQLRSAIMRRLGLVLNVKDKVVLLDDEDVRADWSHSIDALVALIQRENRGFALDALTKLKGKQHPASEAGYTYHIYDTDIDQAIAALQEGQSELEFYRKAADEHNARQPKVPKKDFTGRDIPEVGL